MLGGIHTSQLISVLSHPEGEPNPEFTHPDKQSSPPAPLALAKKFLPDVLQIPLSGLARIFRSAFEKNAAENSKSPSGALLEGIENLDRRPLEIEQLTALQEAIFNGELQADTQLRQASEAYRRDLLRGAVAIRTQLEIEYTLAEERAQLERKEPTDGYESGEPDVGHTEFSSDAEEAVKEAENRLQHFDSLLEEIKAIDFSEQADLGVGLEELSALLPEFHGHEIDWVFSQVRERMEEVEAISPKHSQVLELKERLEVAEELETISAADLLGVLAKLEAAALWVSVEERIQLYSEMLESAAMTDAIINGAGLWDTGLNLAPEYLLAQTEYIRAHRLLTEGKYQEARELFIQLEQAPENLSLLENYQNSQRINQCTISAGIVIASAGTAAIAAELAGGAAAYLGGGAKLIQGVRFATHAAAFTMAHRRLETWVHGKEFFDPKLSAAENALMLTEETALNAGMFAFLGKAQKLYGRLVQRGIQTLASRRLAFHSYLQGRPLGREVQKALENQISALLSPFAKAGGFATELGAFSTWNFLTTNYQLAKQGDLDPIQAFRLSMNGAALEDNFIFLLALKAGGALVSPLTRPMQEAARRWAMTRYQARVDKSARTNNFKSRPSRRPANIPLSVLPGGPLMVFGTFWGLWNLFRSGTKATDSPTRPAKKIGERLRRQVDAALRDRSGEAQPFLVLDAQTGKILTYPDSPHGILRVNLQRDPGSGRWFLNDESFQGVIASYKFFKDPQRRVILEAVLRLGHVDQLRGALADLRREDAKSMLSGAFPQLPADFPRDALPKLTHPEVRKTRHWKTMDAQSTAAPTRFNLSPFYDVFANMEGRHEGPGILFKVAPQENRPANELLEVYLHVGEYLGLMPADTPVGKKPKVVIYVTLPAKNHPFRRGDLVDLRFTDSPSSGSVDPSAFGMPLMIFDPRSLLMRGLKRLWDKLAGVEASGETRALTSMNEAAALQIRRQIMDSEKPAAERREALKAYERLIRERFIADEEIFQAIQDFRLLMKDARMIGRELLDVYWVLVGRLPEGHPEVYEGARALREFYGSYAGPVLAEKAAMIYWSMANLFTAGDPRNYEEGKALRTLVVKVRAGWQMMSNYSVLAKKFGKDKDALKEEAIGLQQISANPLNTPVLRHETEAALRTLLTLLPEFDPTEPQLFTVLDKGASRGVKYLLEVDPKSAKDPKKLWTVAKITHDQIILKPFLRSGGDKTVPVMYLLYFGKPPRFTEGAVVEMIAGIGGGVDLNIELPFIEGEPLLGISEWGEPFYLFHKDFRLSHQFALSVKIESIDPKRNSMTLGLVDPKQAVAYGTQIMFNFRGENPYRKGQRLMLVRPVRGAAGPPEDFPAGGQVLQVTSEGGRKYELRKVGVNDVNVDPWYAVILQARKIAAVGEDIYRHSTGLVHLTLGYATSIKTLMEGIYHGKWLEQLSFVLEPESASKIGIEFDGEGTFLQERMKGYYLSLRPLEATANWTPMIADSEVVLTKASYRSYILKLTDKVEELVLGRGEGAFGQILFQIDRTISRRHVRITRDELGRFRVENLSKTHLLQIDFPGKPWSPILLAFGKQAFIEGNEVLHLGKARVHLYYEP